MGGNIAPNLVAGGTIRPSRFVKMSTTADHTGLECDANEKVIGIAQVGTFDPPGLAGSGAQAASAGDPIQIWGQGDICLLEAGSGGFVEGDDLKSDADGKGVPALTTGTVIQQVGAVALESAAENELGRVQVVLKTVLPAVA